MSSNYFGDLGALCLAYGLSSHVCIRKLFLSPCPNGNHYASEKAGFASCQQRRTLGELQFTAPFIEFVFVETNRLLGSNANVILTRQKCGQRSSMAVASKRREITLYFVV